MFAKRIQSVDILRGLVMLIMALDHVRDYFHISANTDDPMNLLTTTPFLFFTRYITHFCAPVFVFLSGISIYLQSLRKSKTELGGFLIKRGLWLLLIEFTIVTFAWTFNPNYTFVIFQVIWAIGISMFILGLLIRLPFKAILTIGLFIVLGHNLLDNYEASANFKASVWLDLMHSSRFSAYEFLPGHSIMIPYPFLPWTGLMMLGYCMGIYFEPKITVTQRRKVLLISGITLIVIFVVLRFINQYGNPEQWSTQQSGFYTFLSFISVYKYPPSLMFMCMTIGPALILLALLEKLDNIATQTISVFGRTAFFYYVLHIYLIHLLAVIAFFVRGHGWDEVTKTGETFPFYFSTPGEGYGLPVVYIIWLLVILLLFPLCKWFDTYKTSHKEKHWLSYL